MQQLIEHSSSFTYPHDRKVAALGLVKFIEASPFTDLNCTLFQVLVSILASYENQPNTSKFTQLEAQLKKLSEQGAHASNEVLKATTLMQMNKKLSSEEIEAELALSTFLTPLASQDEFDYFRNFLQHMNQAAQGTLQQMVCKLNQVQGTQLFNIIQSKRVELLGYETSVTDVRRVVKPKRRLA